MTLLLDNNQRPYVAFGDESEAKSHATPALATGWDDRGALCHMIRYRQDRTQLTDPGNTIWYQARLATHPGKATRGTFTDRKGRNHDQPHPTRACHFSSGRAAHQRGMEQFAEYNLRRDHGFINEYGQLEFSDSTTIDLEYLVVFEAFVYHRRESRFELINRFNRWRKPETLVNFRVYCACNKVVIDGLGFAGLLFGGQINAGGDCPIDDPSISIKVGGAVDSLQLRSKFPVDLLSQPMLTREQFTNQGYQHASEL